VRVAASRKLLAPREDVWKLISEPYRLRDWWPGIAGLQPDRRGSAPGARWQLVGDDNPRWLRRPNMTGVLLVLAVEPPEHLAFLLTGDRLQVDLRLADAGSRTLATLIVEGPPLIGLRRRLPERALARLYALCQTGADFE
jgi:uncharacterized protein YndB with AHSA1/START domain